MKRRLFYLLLVLFCPAVAQEVGRERAGKGSADGDEPPASFAFPQLAVLDAFIGPWSVTESHLNARGEVTATVKGTEETAWVLDHRAIRRNYNTRGASSAFKAVGTLTWNDVEKKYHGVWFDNVSTTGPGVVKGTWDAAALTMLFELESVGPTGGVLRHRIVDKFKSAEERIVTTYQLDSGGLIKRTEVEYHRTKPCPDRLRIFFDR